MLEIAILVILAGKLGKIVQKKGRKKIGYQLLLIGMWIIGELFGGFMGGLLGALMNGENPMLVAIVGALSCAIVAAVIVFAIVKSLEPLAVEVPLSEEIARVEALGARERFGDRKPAPPAIDAYTGRTQKTHRTPSDRIQE